MRPVMLAAALGVLCAAAPVPAAAVAVRSEVEGLRIAAVDSLPAPRRPQRFGEGDFCRNIQIEPKTPAGRHAAALGWYVTSEAEQAGYTAVGIFSRGGDATSGTCLIADGNVVLYRGERPVAIVYEPPGPADEGGLVGGVLPTLTPGRLRISDWTPPGFAHADILLDAGSVTVVPIAALETACGDVGLPNLRGLDIPAARKALAPHGWKPARFRAPEPRTGDLRRQEFTELEICSGTGYGFCAARYTHAGGAVLDVTTIGEELTIASYKVRCPGDG